MKNNTIYRYLIYLLLVFFVMSAVSLSRYATTISGSDSARVAGIAYEFEEIGSQEYPPYGEFEFIFKGATSIEEDPDALFTSKTSEADPLFYLVCDVKEYRVLNTGECEIDFSLELLENDDNPEGFHWALIDKDLIISESEDEMQDSDYLIYDEIDDNDLILNYPKIINRLGKDCLQTINLPIGSEEKQFLLVMWVDYTEITDGGENGMQQEPRRDVYVEADERSYGYRLKHQVVQVD